MFFSNNTRAENVHFSFVFFFEEFTDTVYRLGLNMFVRCPLILWSECSAFRVSECVPTRKQKTKMLLIKLE